MQKIKVFVFLIFLGHMLGAQTFEPQELKGRVYSVDGDVAATHVLNMTSKKAAITDIDGFFSITAKWNDTVVFSAVQYKKKQIVITLSMLESSFLAVPLEESVTELDEVVVMPYNLTGDMKRDADRLRTDPVVTASTLGLPNAYVKTLTQSERALATARDPRSVDFLFNALSGRTKRLKRLVGVEKKYARTQRVRAFYPDSVLTSELKIPAEKIADFMYFCEIDASFQAAVDARDRLLIWEHMRKRSILYRKNNTLE
ncbi:carboxypeptidase-like regulatory domain-containing protein [Maribacter sp. 2-571]|uniref:carboxypeptidase-like regulatory domain-containing protein n=1 Tax=Maribacter sp. 2-571 TaxID=3417569 RepID=UPI003D3400E8